MLARRQFVSRIDIKEPDTHQLWKLKFRDCPLNLRISHPLVHQDRKVACHRGESGQRAISRFKPPGRKQRTKIQFSDKNRLLELVSCGRAWVKLAKVSDLLIAKRYYRSPPGMQIANCCGGGEPQLTSCHSLGESLDSTFQIVEVEALTGPLPAVLAPQSRGCHAETLRFTRPVTV